MAHVLFHCKQTLKINCFLTFNKLLKHFPYIFSSNPRAIYIYVIGGIIANLTIKFKIIKYIVTF